MSEAEGPRRLLDFLELAHRHLESKGIAGARLDAELLLAEVLGMSRIELYTSYDRPLSKPEVDAYRELLRRRAAREPVAYIIGRREFWSLQFAVDRRVLIPRPETELLVESAVKVLRERVVDLSGSRRLRVADVGTGSGAVAVALATEVSELDLVATDASAAVLEVAPDNARRHGVVERIEFRQGDACGAFDEGERFDVIVSNPPYVADGELAELEPEIRNWEPRSALAAGHDGLDVVRRLVAEAPAYLEPDGWLLVEIGSTQADAVARLLEGESWRSLAISRDLAGNQRVVAARPPCAESRRAVTAS
jgi:release factor glutamine methyltransferase